MSIEIRGYHTLEDRDNVDQIENNGPQKCTHPNAWLGDGYYFWDTDIKWAHDWGIKTYNGNYVIFEVGIRIDSDTFDLFGNVSHINELKQARDLMIKKGAEREKITVGRVIEYIRKHIGFPYSSIRASDRPNNPEMKFSIAFSGKRQEAMFGGDRVQVCLCTKKNIISPAFRAIYPSKYKN